MRLPRRTPGLEERVSRIEERMATRDDIAELRAAMEGYDGGPPRPVLRRRLTRAVAGAALCVGLAALILALAR